MTNYCGGVFNHPCVQKMENKQERQTCAVDRGALEKSLRDKKLQKAMQREALPPLQCAVEYNKGELNNMNASERHKVELQWRVSSQQNNKRATKSQQVALGIATGQWQKTC